MAAIGDFELVCGAVLDEADAAFGQIHQAAVPTAHQPVVTATQGLLHFRRGRIAQGRAHYAEAIRLADEAGLDVVYDRCMKVEHARFAGGLTTAGMNSGVITSRRRH